MKKDGKQPQTEQHKSAGEQYFCYLLDNPWWRSDAEAESFAALMFIDDIEDWKNEG